MSQDHAEQAYEYFAAPYRERKIRTPELELWIACLANAKTQAGQLAAGVPHEKASKDIRRLRWQLAHDVADMWAWLHGDGNDKYARQRGGQEISFPWILSQLEAGLGRGCYDEPRYVAHIAECLHSAEAKIAELAHAVARSAMLRGNKAAWPQWRYRRMHLALARAERTYQPQRQMLLILRGLCPAWDALDAAEGTTSVPRADVRRQDERATRLLPEASRSSAKAVGTRGQRSRGKAVAKAAPAHPRARRLSVPVRGMPA